MTVLVEHDNGFRGQHSISEDNIATLDKLPSLIQSYIQAGLESAQPNLDVPRLKKFLTFSKNFDII